MNTLSAFMKKNARLPENKHVAISKRFVDKETGKPMEWELRMVTEKENSQIKESCTDHDYSREARRTGQTTKFDAPLYIKKLLVASVVFPDLNNRELQADYGVVAPEDLLVEMLYAEEYAILQDEIDNFTGYISRETKEAKDEVKNS